MSSPLIGVFDSGAGGLSVLSALREAMPTHNFLYFGDTARLPYGNKDARQIESFALQIGNYLQNAGCAAVVIACNSAASVAQDALKEELKVPVFGVIDATVQAALASSHGRIGVVGTAATIRARAYQKPMEAAGRLVWAKDCPMFVPLVEEGVWHDEIASVVAHHYLQDAPDDMDALILGCTHYPFLKQAIGHVLPQVTLIDSAHATATQVKENMPATKAQEGTTHYQVTGDPEIFAGLAGRLGIAVAHVAQVSL